MSTNSNQQKNLSKIDSSIEFNKMASDSLQECRVRNSRQDPFGVIATV